MVHQTERDSRGSGARWRVFSLKLWHDVVRMPVNLLTIQTQSWIRAERLGAETGPGMVRIGAYLILECHKRFMGRSVSR